MPIVTLTLRAARSAAFKNHLLAATHAALMACGVHQQDTFQRILELSEDHFRFDPSYPDLQHERSSDFVLIEILWGVGRSVLVKKKMLNHLMADLSERGVDPEQVMVCFQDVPWENWSAAGGRLMHA